MVDVTPGRSKSAIAVAVVLVVGCVVGGLGFVLGRDSATPADAKQKITAVADTQELAAARKQGYRRGFAAGRRSGRSYDDGVTAGRRQGFQRGYERGGFEALGGARWEFAPATFYIVQFAASAGGPELRISDVHQMYSGPSYVLCNTNDLCQRAP